MASSPTANTRRSAPHIIAFGAGTSVEGHVLAVQRGIAVDLREMHRIVAVRAEDLDATVEAGVTREDLNTYLRDSGLFFPIDPGANATLGGTCTGEHGIGLGKMDFLEREHASSIALLRTLKRAPDPLNVPNPGRLLRLDA